MKTMVLCFLFNLTLCLSLISTPAVQAPAWAGTDNKAIFVVGNLDDETGIQSVAAIRKNLKVLREEGKIKYKLLAYDFTVGEQKKYLDKLGIGASAIPLLTIVDLYPDDTPKTILWRTSAKDPDKAVRALLAELGISIGATPRPTASKGEVKSSPKPWIGISAVTLTKDTANAYDMPIQFGVLVDSVVAYGPSAKAGIAPGDVITEINNQKLLSVDDFKTLLNGFSPGQVIALTVWHQGKSKRLSITVERFNQ